MGPPLLHNYPTMDVTRFQGTSSTSSSVGNLKTPSVGTRMALRHRPSILKIGALYLSEKTKTYVNKLVIIEGYGMRATTIEDWNVLPPTLCFA